MPKFYLLLLIMITLFTSCVQESQITPVELLCEAKINPMGIATMQPKFSWKNEASLNNTKQTAYQILVASSPALLKKGIADLWDSGKELSSKSVWILYKGKTLQSRSAKMLGSINQQTSPTAADVEQCIAWF